MDPYRRACPARFQPDATRQRHWIFDCLESSRQFASGADCAKAISLRVDDARSPVELGSVVAAIELVGITEILCLGTISAARRALRCVRGGF
jgi:hypothetical protein